MAKVLKIENVLVIRSLLEECIKEVTEKLKFEFLPVDELLKGITERMMTRNCVILVNNTTEPESMIIATVGKSIVTTDTLCSVLFAFTRETNRGKGLATSLLQALPMVASTLGANRIFLVSSFMNSLGSKNLAVKMGYEEVETAYTLVI